MTLHPEFSAQDVFIALASIGAGIAILTRVGRMWFVHASRRSLTKEPHISGNAYRLATRTKYAQVDVYRFRGPMLLLGLALSLLMVVVLMNWTTVKTSDELFQNDLYVDMDIEVTPPQTSEPPPLPPPPPPPQVIEVPDVLVDNFEESVQFIDQSIDASAAVEAPPAPPETKAPVTVTPPPPPQPREDAEEIFKVVEEMPRFPGCEDMAGNANEKRICAEKALYAFIRENLNYPSAARENNIQGNVVVQFVVNKDGSIQDATVIRDIGANCGEEVLRVVSLMNEQQLRWSPGKQRGAPVRVIFILPVRFTLMSS